MKMIDMEQEGMSQPTAMTESKYPYGLELRLDEASLKKLEVKELPAVGDYFIVMAKAEVVSVSSMESKRGGENRHLCLQICEMAPLQKAKEEKKTEEVLYG